MLEYLDKLRTKPRHVRERIALLSAAMFSLLVGGVWWGAWSADSVAGGDNYPSKDISPVSALTSIVGRAKDSTHELLSGLVDPVQYSASGTGATAQVGSALDHNEKNENDIVYPQDIIDNTIHTDKEAVTSSASTSVQ